MKKILLLITPIVLLLGCISKNDKKYSVQEELGIIKDSLELNGKEVSHPIDTILFGFRYGMDLNEFIQHVNNLRETGEIREDIINGEYIELVTNGVSHKGYLHPEFYYDRKDFKRKLYQITIVFKEESGSLMYVLLGDLYKSKYNDYTSLPFNNESNDDLNQVHSTFLIKDNNEIKISSGFINPYVQYTDLRCKAIADQQKKDDGRTSNDKTKESI